MDEILTCEPSNRSCRAVIYYDAIYYAVQRGVNLRVEDQIFKGMIVQMKATDQCLTVVLFILLYEVVLIFECEDEVMMCDNLNES